MQRPTVLLLALAAQLASRPAFPMPPEVEALARQGQSHLYNLEFSEASAAFQQLRRLAPRHPAGPFLLGAAAWWKARYTFQLPTGDSSRAVSKTLGEAAGLARKLAASPATACEGKFFLGGALGLQAHWELLQGHYLTAAREARESVRVLGELESCTSYADEARYGLGLYGYEASRLPWEMRWVSTFVIGGFSNKRDALVKLERAAEHARYVRSDAQAILAYVFSAYEPDAPRALAWAAKLRGERPDSPVAHTMVLEALSVGARFEELLVESARDHARAREPGSSFASEAATYRYFQGFALLGLRRTDEALEAFSAVVRMEGRPVWIVSALLRRGCAYDLLGRRKEALADYRAVLRRRDAWGQARRAKK